MNPLCRYFLVCAEGHVTAAGELVTVTQPSGTGFGMTYNSAGGDVVLVNPVHAIRPLANRPRYPVYENLVLFAQMTNGTGSHGISVELIRWHEGREYPVFRTPETPLAFGNDPTAVSRYYLRLAPIIFPVAAQYSFRLLCDGQEIGQAEVELEVFR